MVIAPFVAVIEHGPSNWNVAEYAPFAFDVVLPEPFLQISWTVAFASAAPIAAVPLTVPDGDEPPPPQATSALVASTTDPNRKGRRVAALRSFIDFLLKEVTYN
jgi:hypothetical protein